MNKMKEELRTCSEPNTTPHGGKLKEVISQCDKFVLRFSTAFKIVPTWLSVFQRKMLENINLKYSSF